MSYVLWVGNASARSQQTSTAYELLCTRPLDGGSWLIRGATDVAGTVDGGGMADFVIKVEELLTDLGVSRTSLFIYETVLKSSYVLFKGLRCRLSTFLGGDKPLEELITLSGDLRRIWSKVQEEKEFLEEYMWCKSSALLVGAILPKILVSVGSGIRCRASRLVLSGWPEGWTVLESFSRRSMVFWSSSLWALLNTFFCMSLYRRSSLSMRPS